jgi:tRNA(Ile)-lysidine synthase
VDHALDPGSQARARRAEALAVELGLAFRLEHIDVPALRERGESPEAAARRLRYAGLERVRCETGATRILTAHHRDDQVETLLLQLARAVPLELLGGIAASRGALLRPLLFFPRAALLAELRERGIEPIEDPTNRDLRIPRNRLRHALLPGLREREPGLDDALLALGARSRELRARLDRRFHADLSGSVAHPPVAWLKGLPKDLRLPALRWLLAERLGVERSPSLRSMEAFLSQLERGRSARLRLPGGAGEVAVRSGELRREAPESRPPPFTYSFLMPGEIELPELGLRLRIGRAPVEPWMFRGDPNRAALAGNAAHATVRTRRPGDRLRPLGAAGARKLKELLIDRRVPVGERDRLPLLELDGRLAWVPGVAIDDAFRLTDESECWVAEMIPASQPLAESEARGERMSKT